MTRFDEFWALVERKIDRMDCETKITGILNGGMNLTSRDKDGNSVTKFVQEESIDVIIEGMKAYRWDTINTETQWVKHPGTWINRAAWRDYEPEMRAAKARKYDEIHASGDNIIPIKRPGPLKRA